MAKTVFVLGAGASKELGLPLGSELTKRISSLLDFRLVDQDRPGSLEGGDTLLRDSLLTQTQDNLMEYLKAAQQIRDAMPLASSIDQFIDARSGAAPIEFCGKLAIARAILEAESLSKLQVDPDIGNIDFEAVEGTWYIQFFRSLVDGCRVQDLEKRLSGAAFVIFNYDRCFEHFLFIALQVYYEISAEESAALIDGLEIYHPYGVVGCLPWQGRSERIEFGSSPSPAQLIAMTRNIKTFTEGTDTSSSEILRLRSLMNIDAETIVFLGFAFHRLNVELLFPGKTGNRSRCRAYASTYGLSLTDIDLIKIDLELKGGILQKNTEFSYLHTCSELFGESGRAFRFD